MVNEGQMPLREANPSLAHMIEDVVLFGRAEELDLLVEQIADHPDVSSDLRYALESLKYFRAHYSATLLPSDERQRVSQYDTSWSMNLISMLNDGHSFDALERSA